MGSGLIKSLVFPKPTPPGYKLDGTFEGLPPGHRAELRFVGPVPCLYIPHSLPRSLIIVQHGNSSDLGTQAVSSVFHTV